MLNSSCFGMFRKLTSPPNDGTFKRLFVLQQSPTVRGTVALRCTANVCTSSIRLQRLLKMFIGVARGGRPRHIQGDRGALLCEVAFAGAICVGDEIFWSAGSLLLPKARARRGASVSHQLARAAVLGHVHIRYMYSTYCTVINPTD